MGRARGRLTWSEWLTTLLPHTTLHFTSQGTGASQTLRSLESRACKGKGVGGGGVAEKWWCVRGGGGGGGGGGVLQRELVGRGEGGGERLEVGVHHPDTLWEDLVPPPSPPPPNTSSFPSPVR